MNKLRQLLELALNDSLWEETARLAIKLIDSSTPLSINIGDGAPQSSKELAKTYALRRSMKYFGKSSVFGLDETIELLDKSDRAVRLCYIQMDRSLIFICIEEYSQMLCGLLIIKSDE
jgi:hypothetical protein